MHLGHLKARRSGKRRRRPLVEAAALPLPSGAAFWLIGVRSAGSAQGRPTGSL